MKRYIPAFCIIFTLVVLSRARGADPIQREQVKLSIENTRRFVPPEWPVVVKFTMKNIGEEPIQWLSAGPGSYPGAEHFIVEVKHPTDGNWSTVKAANGQYKQGSARTRELNPGQSIVVPMVVPVKGDKNVAIRIRPRDWRIAKPLEIDFDSFNDAEALRKKEDELVYGIMGQKPFFQLFVAARYADQSVVEKVMQLAVVDNPYIAARAIFVLANRRSLPKQYGSTLGKLVQRWLPPSHRTRWVNARGYLPMDIVNAALKTEDATAREFVLDVLSHSKHADSAVIIIDALASSPGDDPWLRQARKAIEDAQKQWPNETKVNRRAKTGLEIIDSRLRYPGSFRNGWYAY